MTFQKPKAFVSVNEETASQCLKITLKMSHFDISILAFSPIFELLKSYLSGNPVGLKV